MTFAWAKATEGLSFNDADFAINATNAKAAGVYFGAYHFAHPTNSPTSEAAHFWSIASAHIKGDGLTLMPMLDMEIFTGVSGAASYSDWANQWCNYVASHAAAAGINVRPVIYISSCNACYLDGSVSQWIAWLANYNGLNPQTGNPWNVCTSCAVWGSGFWNVWQYSSTATVPGVSGNCDVDVFNGTAATLVSTLVVPQTPVIVNQPQNITVNQGASANFAVSATGAGTLRYQWMFNGTNIAGATLASYGVANAQTTSAGAYSVAVSNAGGGTFSSPAFLSVIAPLSNAPGSVVAPPGLVNWWPADGNTIDIFSGNNATAQGGFSYSAGKSGRAFRFDGATSYLTTGRPSIAAPWTACVWVNRQNAAGPAAAVLGDGAYELKLEQYNGTRQVGFTQFGVGDYAFGYIAPANVWTHLAFVGTATNTSLYVNGVLQATLTNTLPLPRAYIGAGYVNSGARFVDYMLGSVDELLTFNRALTPAQISSIYSAGSSGLVRAPEFTGTVPLGNGRFQVNLRGQTGKNFTLYSSPDLVTWTSLGIVGNPSGSIQFIDSSASDPVRFYRATQP